MRTTPQPSPALLAMWQADAKRGVNPFEQLGPAAAWRLAPTANVSEDEQPLPAKKPGRRLGLPTMRSR